MRFSIFTPTHNPEHFGRLAESIRRQTFDRADFEWIIVPNGQATVEPPEGLRVKIVPAHDLTGNVGALKRFACARAEGEILVETDHDDELTPDCLEKLDRAFEPHIDFCYSNCCELRQDQPHVYSPAWGWRWRPFCYLGRELKELVAFDPTPAAFSRIWYAPNHVRAWRRSFYDRIGGHDATRKLLDDQDMCARSYPSGEVRHVDECLYIYHYHAANTSQEKKANAEIQRETWRLHDRYLEPLVGRWCDLQGLRKIDLCGGKGGAPGYETVDKRNAAIAADLDRRWPFEDGSVGVFRASDCAGAPPRSDPHDQRGLSLPGPQRLAAEQYAFDRRPRRVSGPNSRFLLERQLVLVLDEEEQAAYIGNETARFQAVRILDYYPSDWHRLHRIPYVRADLLKYAGRVPGMIEFQDLGLGSWDLDRSKTEDPRPKTENLVNKCQASGSATVSC